MKRPVLSYAKLSHPFVHAPGLFRSFEKGEQKKLKLDITYTVKDADATTRFSGPEALGATDLRVLQGLVAVTTGQLRAEGGVKKLLRDGRTERAGLELKDGSLAKRTIAARFKLYAFAQALGYTSPSSATLVRLRKSIERLSAITVFAQRPGFCGSYRILSGYCEDMHTGELVVGLNPELTAAVLAKHTYLRVDFDEVYKLKSDPARLIHSRLHWINPGTYRHINLETLCKYVYADTPATASAASYRKNAARKALQELVAVGWSVSETCPGKYVINRPGQSRPLVKR